MENVAFLLNGHAMVFEGASLTTRYRRSKNIVFPAPHRVSHLRKRFWHMRGPGATTAIIGDRGEPWTGNYTAERRKTGFTGAFTQGNRRTVGQRHMPRLIAL